MNDVNGGCLATAEGTTEKTSKKRVLVKKIRIPSNHHHLDHEYILIFFSHLKLQHKRKKKQNARY